MIHNFRSFILLFMVISVAGCSSIVSGTDQSMTVMSQPTGAVCLLSRDGATVGSINPTPGTIEISRSKDVLQIECKKEGFLATSEFLTPEGTAGMAGNALISVLSLGIGAVAVAIDSASGAAHEYPESVEIVLVPETFATEAEREAFFDDRLSQLDERYSAVKSELQDRCITRPTEHCRTRLEELEVAWADRIESLEEIKKKTRVAAGDT